jgi:hypothetical protein
VGDLAPAVTRVPLSEETAKRIWDMLKLQLPAYAVFKSDRPSTDQDAEAQDPMKVAIKEAIKEREQELQAIADHVRIQVEDIANRTVEKLREMDFACTADGSGLHRWPKQRRGEPRRDTIYRSMRGSGVRRLIFNFFRAKREQLAAERPRRIT